MIWDVSPVLFSVGFLKVHYYGIIYMSGFMVTYYFLLYLVKKNYLSVSKIAIENFIFYVVIWTVVGARLFEVLFYSGSYFLHHPLKVFAIWEGGLSFHGGLAGVILYCIYFSRKNNISSWKWLDYCSIPASFALCLGRIANFINSELYGLPVKNQVHPPFYAVQFPLTDILKLYRVPTQLLESLGNFLTFIILLVTWLYIKKKVNYPIGLLSMLFLFFYGFFRFIVEFWKDYERNVFLFLTTGQLLCIPMILSALIGFILIKRHGSLNLGKKCSL